MTNRVDKYIKIKEAPNPGKKTKIWGVYSTAGDFNAGGLCGTIRWYGGWRKYVFYSAVNNYYDSDFLRKIANFCEEKTKEHYAL